MSTYNDRLDTLVGRYLGVPVCDLLADPETEEVYVNPDMQLRYISATLGRCRCPALLDPQNVEAFLRAIATITSNVLDENHPSLAAAMMHDGLGKYRIQGFIPPLTQGPAFIIRKPCLYTPGLDQYVSDGILSAQGLGIIDKAIRLRRNILVAGPTASGKTTLCNAILLTITKLFPNERLVILEDTSELRITAQDCLRLQTTDTISMKQLVKYSLRATPNRIIVGEVRDGSAKDLLDAWITGHPGGCGTIHGENTDLSMERLADLARDGAGSADQKHLVLRAVHLVVVITGFGKGRIVKEIARPVGVSPAGFEFEFLLNH